MSASEIESILNKVERLSTDDKKLLIKRVVDLLVKLVRRRKPHRTLQTSQQQGTVARSAQQRSALDESIAAYAARYGGGSDDVDLDPALEAASLENWLDEDGVR